MSARDTLNYGYFYDALSGEFLPPSDPKCRTHTLARLMNATIEKGEVANAGALVEGRIFTPSWAPIRSVVSVSNWDIFSLMITTDARELRFVHTINDMHSRSLDVIDTNVSFARRIYSTPLGAESDYAGIQARVRDIAQNFFEVFPAPEIVEIS